ncbi:hypothetical protein C0Q70_16318 [Pomacea canaliculata]|uniref:PDZ domain-containing protein n=1 Tax=Pomacea canaliculata TaxID=400727 RepID=A0A2T7NPH3_POMCA|nr:hypothetical protein C0Q70_16318 [Pomacea canaliculata]
MTNVLSEESKTMAGLVRKCPCLRPKIEEDVRVLDYRHSSLTDVPGEVFNFERTLEELYTDSNQIRDLPRELFYCHGLRKLSISDNEITSIPPAIASLDHLEELDFSKNGIIDVPDNIKCCKYLHVIDASVNPLGKLPEGFTQLQNLTHLYLNDTFLDYLPGSFGRLVKLRILEIRENHLKTLPKSFGRLTELERLDIGNNEFTDLPDIIGSLTNLLELWCDNNQILRITHMIGALKQLMFLDASNNDLEALPGEIEGCTSLADLHLSGNLLRSLPDSLGNLSSLTTLKVDDNELTSLPKTLGGLSSLSELNISMNDLEELPASIGLLRNLRTFYADENLLTFVPAELGSCSGITVLSLRKNKLTYIPDELGRIPRLRVLNLSDNYLSYLPFTIVKLKELQALWLTENQTRPLIPLQSDYEPETGRKILTCYLLPQGGSENDDNEGDGDSDSFHASIWDEERLRRQQIHFNFSDDPEEEGHLVRCPTPYPKEMREKARHMRNLAMRQTLGSNSEPTGWTPEGSSSHSFQDQKDSSNFMYGSGEVRVREARIAKPQSPSLQETHRLYRYDKEKLLKDKARMQHRHSMPDIPDNVATAIASSGKRGAVGLEEPEAGPLVRRKSTPNLLSAEGERTEGEQRIPALTYEDLYKKPLLQQHQHHRGSSGRRSRRMREYDSDTGYRSEQEMFRFNRQVVDDSRSRRPSHDMSNSPTPSSRPSTAMYMSHHQQQQSQYHQQQPPPSPSQFDGGSMLDQSTPITIQAPQSFLSASAGSGLYPQATGQKEQDLHRELYTPSPSLETLHKNSLERPPPPYQPAPPYHMTPRKKSVTSSRVSESDASAGSSKEGGGGSGSEVSYQSSSYSNPEYTTIQFVDQPRQEDKGVRKNYDALSLGQRAPEHSYTGQQRRSSDIYCSGIRNSPVPRTQRERANSDVYALGRFSDLQYSLSSHKHSENPSQASGGGHFVDQNPQPTVFSDKVMDRSRDSLTPVSSQYGKFDPNNARQSPHQVDPQKPRERSNSRVTIPGGKTSNIALTSQTAFEAYPNPYGEPMEAGDPLMMRFEDVAIFKNMQEPSSQVSSSTDSGYGHSHHIYEHIGDFQHRHSGSPHSSTPPSHRNTPVRRNSSSQGTSSRETTPVKEEGFYSVQGHTLSETTCQESREVFRAVIQKNPGLGFSIAGGHGSRGNPFREGDMGIFVTKVQPEGPAASVIQPGDKILKVNHIDFRNIDHSQAVNVMKTSVTVELLVERIQKINLV